MKIQTCAGLLAVVFSNVSFAQASLSAHVGTGSSAGPGSSQTTLDAGQVVSLNVSASDPIAGSVSGFAQAQTYYGTNRISTSGGVVAVNLPTQSGVAYTVAGADSSWQDFWHVSGGAQGDLINLSLSGSINYSWNLTGGAVVQAPGVQADYSFFIGSSIDSKQIAFDTAAFAAGNGLLNWSTSIAARTGDTISVSAAFSSQMNGGSPGLQLEPTFTDKTASFESMHSSVLGVIALTPGYGLEASSGQLASTGQGFAYPVPEPGTYALMLAGLVAVGAIVRRGAG